MKLTNRKVLFGISGGIAAYKSAYLARLLVKAGAEVQVIMTEAATKFITPLTFEALTDRDVPVEMFPEGKFAGTHHITYANWPDLVVVSPATADLIAQVAHGFCSSLLSTVICATKRKVIWAPSMNEAMYANPTVQKNIDTLRNLGHIIADVGIGEMACKSYGAGRMAEPEEIFELIADELGRGGPLEDKKIIVTAGACRESLDPVRFMSNRSSGKMGYALAREAERLGGEVSLIAGPTALPDPPGVKVSRIETTDQMAQVVEKEFADSDYLIMAAAPADYKPAISFPQKMKKCDKGMTVELVPTIDILKKLKTIRKNSQILVGFSLETENEVENSKKKLREKALDYIVVNNPLEEGAGFEADTNRVTILSKSGDTLNFDLADKGVIAGKIWEYILADGKR
jgi:phosphopantothenoylcysteine decarboxylase/phosphopantothenate--cysteine ligase